MKKKNKKKNILPNWFDKAYGLQTTGKRIKKDFKIYNTIICGEGDDIFDFFNFNRKK